MMPQSVGEAAGYRQENRMFRAIKVLAVLVVLAVLALAAFAYLGDLRPAQRDVIQPVILDAQ